MVAVQNSRCHCTAPRVLAVLLVCLLEISMAQELSKTVTDGDFQALVAALADNNTQIVTLRGSRDFVLTSQLTIRRQVEIVGACGASGSAKCVLDGGSLFSVLVVEGGVAALTLRHLRLQHGFKLRGGALALNGADLVAEDCEFVENQATSGGGAIYMKGGSLRLSQCLFDHNVAQSGNGGAIAYEGLSNGSSSIITSQSLFKFNEALNGGGVSLTSPIVSAASPSPSPRLQVFYLHTQFLNNYAQERGGGLHASGQVLVTVNASTLQSNKAGSLGGAIATSGKCQLLAADTSMSDNAAQLPAGSTASANGGAIAHTGSSADDLLLLDNCTVARNAADVGGGLLVSGQSTVRVADSVFNLNTARKSAGAIRMSLAGALYVRSSRFTENVALNGPGGAVSHTGRDDMPAWIQDSTFSHNQANNGNGGALSLESTLGRSLTNFSVGGSSFVFNTAKRKGGAIFVSGPATLQCTYSTFDANVAFLSGGALHQEPADLAADASMAATIQHSDFWDSRVQDGSGGAVTLVGASPDASFRLKNLTFKGNQATNNGGAVSVEDSRPASAGTASERRAQHTFLGITFSSNNALTSGGAIALQGWLHLNIASCNFTSNSAEESGGAIFSPKAEASAPVSSTMDLRLCSFVSNEARTQGGGAVHSEAVAVTNASDVDPSTPSSALRITGCTFLNNRAALDGGAVEHITILSARRTLAVSRTQFIGNRADGSGGAIAMTDASIIVRYNSSPEPSVELEDIHLQQNLCLVDGGGIFLLGSLQVAIGDVSFAGNKAFKSGGALVGHDLLWMAMENATFSDNTAVLDGGGMSYGGRSLSLEGCIFERNKAEGSGGGASFANVAVPATAWFRLINVDFFGNSASGKGGAFVAQKLSTNMKLVFCDFSQNLAGQMANNIYSLSSLDICPQGYELQAGPDGRKGTDDDINIVTGTTPVVSFCAAPPPPPPMSPPAPLAPVMAPSPRPPLPPYVSPPRPPPPSIALGTQDWIVELRLLMDFSAFARDPGQVSRGIAADLEVALVPWNVSAGQVAVAGARPGSIVAVTELRYVANRTYPQQLAAAIFAEWARPGTASALYRGAYMSKLDRDTPPALYPRPLCAMCTPGTQPRPPPYYLCECVSMLQLQLVVIHDASVATDALSGRLPFELARVLGLPAIVEVNTADLARGILWLTLYPLEGTDFNKADVRAILQQFLDQQVTVAGSAGSTAGSFNLTSIWLGGAAVWNSQEGMVEEDDKPWGLDRRRTQLVIAGGGLLLLLLVLLVWLACWRCRAGSRRARRPRTSTPYQKQHSVELASGAPTPSQQRQVLLPDPRLLHSCATPNPMYKGPLSPSYLTPDGHRTMMARDAVPQRLFPSVIAATPLTPVVDSRQVQHVLAVTQEGVSQQGSFLYLRPLGARSPALASPVPSVLRTPISPPADLSASATYPTGALEHDKLLLPPAKGMFDKDSSDNTSVISSRDVSIGEGYSIPDTPFAMVSGAQEGPSLRIRIERPTVFHNPLASMETVATKQTEEDDEARFTKLAETPPPGFTQQYVNPAAELMDEISKHPEYTRTYTNPFASDDKF